MKVVAFLQIAVLLATIVMWRVNGEDCELGWFGEQCMHECHCTEHRFCQSNGECSNGKCETAYFGPACQFIDVAVRFSSVDSSNYLTDYVNTTCNPNTSATSVSIKFRFSFKIMWFRLHFKDQHNLNFTVSVNNGSLACVNGHKFKSNFYVDVMCNDDVKVRWLHINGPFAASVCSIKISQGRNLSVKQRTCQSSNYDNATQCCDASKAVDGVQINSCSHTKVENNPHWRLFFKQPSIILAIIILGKEGNSELEGFKIEGFSDTNKTTFIYENPSTVSLHRYSIWGAPTKNLTNQVVMSLIGKDRQLSICEIQIYGENSCPEGTYGLECSERCQCNNRSICNHITGVCSEVCQLGFYGFNCQYQCHEHCLGGLCHQATGQCDECTPGYRGNYCESDCSPGFWGPRCENMCPEYCTEPCNHINGSCHFIKEFDTMVSLVCSPGLWGPHCNWKCNDFCAEPCNAETGICRCSGHLAGMNCSECSPGFWGPMCKNKCSRNCAETCNHKTGSCKCVEHFAGNNCSICSKGYYRKYCRTKCPQFCQTCDRRSGKCLSCLQHRKGKMCEDCVSGKWGGECNENCPLRCDHQCNQTNGHCKCLEHFTGLKCSDCSSGYYEENCTKVCPKFCKGRICDRQSGECLLCLGERVGKFCEECEPKMYGVNCDLNCSAHCQNGTCDQLTGNCLKCIRGFSGESCFLIPIKPAIWVAPFTIVPFFILLLFCIPDCPVDDADSGSSTIDKSSEQLEYDRHSTSV